MTDVRNFIGGKPPEIEKRKVKAIDIAETLATDLKSGKIVGFIAVALDVNDCVYYYTAPAVHFTRLKQMGAIASLENFVHNNHPDDKE